MEINIDTSVSFKVASWLRGVDDRSRHQILTASVDWRPNHTEALLSDIEARLAGGDALDVEMVRTSTDKLLYALSTISSYKDVPFISLFVGLRLIS